jgi:hypothetical protein
MPPIRFRIRTIMIAIVVVAVVMAVFTAVMRSIPPWKHPFRDGFAVCNMIFLGMISHPIIAFLAIVLFVSLVEFAVFWDRFRSLRRKPGRFSIKNDRQIARPEFARSEESKRV